jgi:sec-independent protein translocase protein TatA
MSWIHGRNGTVTAVNLGGPELLIILVVVLLLFGTTKLPKLARSLGQAQGEFKKGLRDGSSAASENDTGTTTPKAD